jgi:Na+-transporting methylmalonyl-CoA/oxaloacetate decarboxylase gamma subunit
MNKMVLLLAAVFLVFIGVMSAIFVFVSVLVPSVFCFTKIVAVLPAEFAFA